MDLARLVKIGEAARMLDTRPDTLPKWERSGELLSTRNTRAGTRYCAVSDLLGTVDEAAPTLSHARVSSPDRKADWDRRPTALEAYCAALAALHTLDKAIARSRNQHGRHRSSKRRNHLYELRSRQHARVHQLRRDHHQATCAIAKTWAVVKVETLNVSGMMQNKRLARSISDAGMAEFVRMLE